MGCSKWALIPRYISGRRDFHSVAGDVVDDTDLECVAENYVLLTNLSSVTV